MQITLNASGDNPKPGSKITYDITIRNPENRDATNINIWDTLPDGCMITGVTSPSPYIYQMNGNVISWDFNSLDLGPAGGADEITVEYTVEITDINAARNSSDGLIHNTASVNYNDPAYPAPGVKHPPIKSDLSLYPTGRPVVFPNPFNPKTAKGGTLKFANMVPGSVIQIFTISGEAVAAITAQGTNVEWDGKNGGGSSMAAGIYYFVITNKTTNSTLKGKLFVVNN
jgi:fimbrial isopeptide formation D2 family protein